jgi:hypothetical protein
MRLVARGVTLGECEAKLSGGVRRRRRRGARGGGLRAVRWRCTPATITSRSPSAAPLSARTFAMDSGQVFSRRLKSSKNLISLRLRSLSSPLCSSRSLRESSPTSGCGCTRWAVRAMPSVASASGAKCARDVGHGRQAHVGLVDAVAADGLVVAHARERRSILFPAARRPRRGSPRPSRRWSLPAGSSSPGRSA